MFASRAGEAAARPRDPPGVFWRVVLLGLSGLGSITALGCAFTGHLALALRILAATLLLLGVLLAVALR